MYHKALFFLILLLLSQVIELILKTKNPILAKNFVRQVSNYNEES